ncbi:MAG: copper amine oxidase N-terminal domain-containing protein [Clostridiales bacterium]|jgi:hypothetical protein|nr:copper amine oxidase N-terminal domain-containing protein [Clostridiales bacterium]
MKRKLALLLAAVFTLSVVPVMNAAAAGVSRSLTPSLGFVPEKTLFFENSLNTSAGEPTPKTDDVEYYVEGPDLLININDDTVRAGATLRLELTNADFAFRNSVAVTTGDTTFDAITAISGASLRTANGNSSNDRVFAKLPQPSDASAGEFWSTNGYTERINPSTITAIANDFTYDRSKGLFGHDDLTGGKSGIYFRIGDLWPTVGGVQDYSAITSTIGSKKLEIPYALEVSAIDDSVANVTILNPRGFANSSNNYTDVAAVWHNDAPGVVPRALYNSSAWQIRIPIVALTLKDEEVRLRVEPAGSSGLGSLNTYSISSPVTSSTNTYFQKPETARSSFVYDADDEKLIIAESRFYSIENGSFELALPRGFEWDKPTKVVIGTDPGLSWNDGISSYKEQNLGFYDIDYKLKSNNDEDKSTLRVNLTGIEKSKRTRGYLYIKGLAFTADDDAPYGEIKATIKNVSGSDFLTTQTFTAGTRRDYEVTLKTTGTIPTLYSGRYDELSPLDAGDDHKAATVVFEEAVTEAWLSGEVSFVLSKGARFRRVEFTDVDNLTSASEANLTDDVVGTVVFDKEATPPFDVDPGKGEFINDNSFYGDSSGKVRINENIMTLTGFDVQASKRALIEFDSWISIEPGFEGDIKLIASGRGVGTGEDQAVTIAKAVNPVTVETKVTDVKIGYQYQATADIVLKETGAGALPDDKEVWVSVSDMLSNDMRFSPDTVVKVTEGNLDIEDIKSVAGVSDVGSSSYASGGSYLGQVGGSTISFNVRRPSTTASTITLSNVAVRIDRTVPLTNYTPYKVLVWGPGPAGSYYYLNYHKNLRDKFLTAGIAADYLRVITAAEDIGLAKQEVRVTIGARTFTVNGTSYDMDAASYISTASNSTMVPIRFVANALGIDDNGVIWDDTNKVVTINAPNRIVQFTIGSSTMKVNGADVTMVSPDNLPVKAEIVADRSYVPFRAMGYAFGIEVSWDEATQTAIYNPGVGLTTTTTATAVTADDTDDDDDTTTA